MNNIVFLHNNNTYTIRKIEDHTNIQIFLDGGRMYVLACLTLCFRHSGEEWANLDSSSKFLVFGIHLHS